MFLAHSSGVATPADGNSGQRCISSQTDFFYRFPALRTSATTICATVATLPPHIPGRADCVTRQICSPVIAPHEVFRTDLAAETYSWYNVRAKERRDPPCKKSVFGTQRRSSAVSLTRPSREKRSSSHAEMVSLSSSSRYRSRRPIPRLGVPKEKSG